jgi:hypothetical protein
MPVEGGGSGLCVTAWRLEYPVVYTSTPAAASTPSGDAADSVTLTRESPCPSPA